MNILIIGSHGFIGSATTNYFLKSGHNVFQADVATDCNKPNYTVLSSVNTVFDNLFIGNDIDVCINCSGAANVSLSVENPRYDFKLNTDNVHKILCAIRKYAHNCKFINLSSAAVYGNPYKLPIEEVDVTNPVSPYGFHKYQAECICKEFYDCYNIKCANLRIFSAYGPGLKKQLFWDMYNKFITQETISLWGTGQESRDFIFIDDLVQAIDVVIKKSSFEADVINVANGTEITIAEVARIFTQTLNSNKTVHFNNKSRIGDPNNWVADINKLRNWGYKPTTNIETGINEYCKWIAQDDAV